MSQNKQDSYIERRQLFKNIWDAAMLVDDKDQDIMSKPKVIKTLRMDELDKCPVGKSKKQKIKNLRHVCKKILDFCDRQDADDTNYLKIATKPAETCKSTDSLSVKKQKKTKIKKKMKKTTSMFARRGSVNVARATTSDWHGSLGDKNTAKRCKMVKIKTSPTKVVKGKKSPEIKQTKPSRIDELAKPKRKPVKKLGRKKKTT